MNADARGGFFGSKLWRLVCGVGAAVVLAAAPSPVAAVETSVSATQDGETVSVRVDGRLILEYRHGDVPAKPYVAKLATPGGVQVLLDAPPDHQHHHGLVFAVGAGGIDFWAEGQGCGKQVGRSPSGVRSGSDDGHAWAEFGQQLDWVGPAADGPLLREDRTIRVDRPPDPHATLVTWQSRLSTAPGRETVELGGSHYFGLGLRMIEAMNATGRFLNASGEPGEVVRGDERLVRARWCAYTAKVDGRPVTVALFDGPANPRHPARMFTMAKPFAYLSATLNLWKEPLELSAGKPLALRYGVLAADGELSAAEVERAYRAWAGAAQKQAAGGLSGCALRDET
jgi:hypothetical protein